MSVRTEPSRQQVTEAEALYRALKEGKASIPQPSAWMRLSLQTKLNGLVLFLIVAQIVAGGTHLLGPSLGPAQKRSSVRCRFSASPASVPASRCSSSRAG